MIPMAMKTVPRMEKKMPRLPLTEPEIGHFAEQLGRTLLQLPVISGVAGHKWAKGTVKDYLRPALDPSGRSEFLIDVFSRPIPEVLLKWYPRAEPGPVFLWPDGVCAGGPGKKELDQARDAIHKAGESVAEYTEQELEALKQKWDEPK